MNTSKAEMHRKKILVGLSGGVDSAVTACILKQEGHDVTGVFMRNWHDDLSHCTNASDEQDAQLVCEKIGIDFQTIDFSQAYMDKVFVSMLESLKLGHTPNPDILCNQEIKFKVLLDYALAQQADCLATGHYAQIKDYMNSPALTLANDQNKDQTYFLCRLSRNALAHIHFPIGTFHKSEIRTMAKKYALENAEKKDSTGICFVGERKFQSFISEHLLDQPGDIVDENQRILGQHRGLFYYTIGQRKGLAIGGHNDYLEQPWFVIAKNMKNNTLIVGQGKDHPSLYRHTLRANCLHWLVDPSSIDTSFSAMARIRHRQPLQSVHIEIKNDTMSATFEKPQRAITPGQSIAVYQNQFCIASAIIQE